MKNLLLIFALIATAVLSIANAQQSPNLKSLVAAENAFADRAIKTSVRQAFLDFLDTSAVVFENGKILNGTQTWAARPASGGALLWHPAFAGIASSGDIGFTTGPWIFKRVVSTDSVLASGYYSTIWIRNNSGIWKAVVDMGIECESPAYQDSMIRTWEGKAGQGHKKSEIMDIENGFITSYEKQGTAAFGAVTDYDSWFNINGHRPFRTADSIRTRAIAAIPSGISFVPVKGRMSSSGDLGYVYGIVNHNGKSDNYLRVWKAGSNGYRLLLQVLNWQ